MAHILIIDDDRLVRDTAKAICRAKGYDVTLAENGKSGVETARAGHFDAVIVDLFMPDMDGLQVIGAICQAKPGLPMIAASGFMFKNDCPEMPNFDAMALEAGAVATLYKPFRPETLMRAIETAMARAAA